MADELEPRVNRLENNHSLLQQELHQMNTTLSKIETAIEKQNEIATDIRLLREEFKSHTAIEIESVKRQNARIEQLEKNYSKLGWMVIGMVVFAVMASILKEGLTK